MSKNGEVSSSQGPSRPNMPKPDLNLFCSEKRKMLDLQLGGPSGDGAAFVPFPSNTPGPKARVPARTIRDVLPDNTRDRCRIYPTMQSSGKLQLSATEIYDFTADDLQDLGEIGRGAFGAVNKMVHRKTNRVMAVKRIRSTVDEKEQKQLLMDLEVVMKSNECVYIVQFYGALFKEGDCWICMELMDTSLDKFYKFICERMQTRIPETILAKITLATVKALNYLKEKLKIIHRDVKPSNILLDRRGNIKLCDFGISERIDPGRARGYDVRSDVWSLGITLMEVATGAFPYPRWGSVFEQLQQVVQGDPPRLTNKNNSFSNNFVHFVNTCLIKEETQRPKYNRLLEHPFIKGIEQSRADVAAYVCEVLDAMERNGVSPFTTDQPAQAWVD
ncbi:Dual specificity mitogen-activated protein kinase kinase 4 [Papilio xuthus]|uniref:mitogen-activated protein kinase kinase n=1 Tax=Papilio xuthus TaxID=66420 RepID=A0A194QBF2_PAPXU|nr:Dual specificity mitogen-activated protein kinase kinase 4 [Papilio xuthus]